jgi:hypothetical protein
VKQSNASADLEGRDEEIERKTLLGRMLSEPKSNLVVHRRRI